MGMMIIFVDYVGEKIAVNSDHIINVEESSRTSYKSNIIYGVSDRFRGVIHMKESLEEVVNYINSGKWESIR